jgi:hypothetical protein
MTKICTTVDLKTALVDTLKVKSVHDRGVTKEGLPILKIIFGEGKPHVFVYTTKEAFLGKEEDITVELKAYL